MYSALLPPVLLHPKLSPGDSRMILHSVIRIPDPRPQYTEQIHHDSSSDPRMRSQHPHCSAAIDGMAQKQGDCHALEFWSDNRTLLSTSTRISHMISALTPPPPRSAVNAARTQYQSNASSSYKLLQALTTFSSALRLLIASAVVRRVGERPASNLHSLLLKS
jgi:hypothetical protein